MNYRLPSPKKVGQALFTSFDKLLCPAPQLRTDNDYRRRGRMIDPNTASAKKLWTIPELKVIPLVLLTGAA